MYHLGLGVEVDEVSAYMWFEIAAASDFDNRLEDMRSKMAYKLNTSKIILIEKSYTTAIKDLILKKYSNKDIVDIIKLFSQDTKKEIYKNVLTIRQNV